MRVLFAFFVSTFLSVVLQAQFPVQKRLDSIMDSYQRLNWNAVVVVGRPGEVLYSRAIGYSDVETRSPLKVDAIVATASAGKMFTATRIMQLIKEGKVDLQTPVKNYLPDWKLPNADKITIHHLLTHTSGLGSPWDHPDYDFKKTYSKTELKKFIEEVPLIFEVPGQRSAYSNTGYQLLAAIIERKDDMSYAASIQKHIFLPAGIRYATDDSNAVKRLTRGYYQTGSAKFTLDPDTRYLRIEDGGGAGGWMLSAQDLFKFMSAYVSGKYLDTTMQRIQMTAGGLYTGNEKKRRYGLAMLQYNFDSPHVVLGHNGGGKGTSADAYFDAETGYIVTMVSNQYATGYAITGNIFRALFNERLITPQHAVEIKVMDYLNKTGAEYLTADPERFFSDLKLKPSEFLFESFYRMFEASKDYSTAESVFSAGRKLFPNSVDILIYGGNLALLAQKKQEALRLYTVAKEICEKAGNNLQLKYVESKIRSINL
jgi:CubicO group peptidase (beta-lactamase class C family)